MTKALAAFVILLLANSLAASTDLLVSVSNILNARSDDHSVQIIYEVHAPEILAGTQFLVKTDSRNRSEVRKKNPLGSLYQATISDRFAKELRKQSEDRESDQVQIDAGTDPRMISNAILIPELTEKELMREMTPHEIKKNNKPNQSAHTTPASAPR